MLLEEERKEIIIYGKKMIQDSLTKGTRRRAQWRPAVRTEAPTRPFPLFPPNPAPAWSAADPDSYTGYSVRSPGTRRRARSIS